jgi:RNA polymerase sigma factor (sigma-70 family)
MEGDKGAGQKMVLANLRLVVKMALDYRSYPNLLDLIQEGNMGLVHAVGKYDPERGTRFSTYASFWIRAYMLKYLMDTWSMVKIGTKDSQRRLFYGLNREKERLERSGIIPSAQVLADNLETSTVDIEDMEQRLYHGDVSLEAPQHGDGDPLMDTIGSGEDVEETLIEKNNREVLHKRLIDFKKKVSGIADDIRRSIGRKKNGAGFAKPDNITQLGSPGTVKAGVVQAVLQPHHRNHGLRLKGRRAFDELQGRIDIKGKQKPFQTGRQLVLASLTGDLNGKSKAFAVENAIKNRVEDLKLIGTQ